MHKVPTSGGTSVESSGRWVARFDVAVGGAVHPTGGRMGLQVYSTPHKQLLQLLVLQSYEARRQDETNDQT